MAEAREARVKVILDINNTLTQIDRIQKKLDTLSIKGLTKDNADKIFNGLNTNVDKASKSIDNLKTKYANSIKEMEKAMKENKLSFTFNSSDEYKLLYRNIMSSRQTLDHLANAFKTVKDAQKNLVSQDTLTKLNKLNKYLSKTNDKTAKLSEKFKNINTDKFEGSIERLTNAINNLNTQGLSNSVNAINRLGNETTTTNSNTSNSNTNRNISSDNNKVSRTASQLLTTYWGTSGEIDHQLDYFFVRFKSGVAKSISSVTENFITNLLPRTYELLSQYQQNRVNFAQVMPDAIGNDTNAMNNAMQQFIQTASDYGTSVQDVVEAGRLWGRQYKDVAIVQELVRNSTKLSITDNMSLIEVNKALEATMQQYNVRLKDSNEAQQVSGAIVDKWAKLADNAVVTAQDMAKANEQAGGSAYQAGVSFDYLQAMIATMSTATGKAGAEVGRAIRSMLVSMNSARSQKFFAQLGIATKELGTDGVMRVRSFEKVIDELMLKLKTNQKDVSKTILAMSGGKFQYNNVMALLKNYDEMQKNLNSVRNSNGWADEQVALQYETIDRQVKALYADLNQLVLSLEKAGATEYITAIIQQTRDFVQIISQIDTDKLKNTISILLSIIALKAGFSAFNIVIRSTIVSIRAMANNIGMMSPIWASYKQGVLGAVTTTRLLGTVVGSVLGTLSSMVMVIGGVIMAYNMYKDTQDEVNKKEKKAIENASANAVALKNKAITIEKLNEDIQKYSEIAKDESKSEDERKDATAKLVKAKEELLALFPEEMKDAKDRIRASGYTKEAIEKEIKGIYALADAQNKNAKNAIQNQIAKTKSVIQQTTNRMMAYKKEMDFLNQQRKIIDKANEASGGRYSFLGVDVADLSLSDGSNSNLLNEYQQKIDKEQASIEQAEILLKSLEQQLKDIEEKANVDLGGGTGGTIDNNDQTDTKNKLGGNYGEKSQVTTEQLKLNKAIADGTIARLEYELAVKKANREEKNSGNTIQGVKDRNKAYEDYVLKLDKVIDDLKEQQNVVKQTLDKEFEKYPKIAEQIGYTTDKTNEQKDAILSANKQSYQHLQTIAKTVKVWEDLRRRVLEYQKAKEDIEDKESNQLPKDAISVADREIARIKHEYDLKNATNSFAITDSEKNQNQIKMYEELQKQLLAKKIEYGEQIAEYDRQHNEGMKQKTQEALWAVELEYENTLSKLHELQLQEFLNFSNTMAQSVTDNMANMLTAGQGFKTTMKNIWNDLTSYIIKRLLKIYVYEQLTGLLTRAFSLKSPTGGGVGSIGSLSGGFTSGDIFSPITSHQGSNISGYPKMHSGGAVELGRQGVNPKLKNDEVIRTLQVGEEVNSIKDRRSNEILGMVAMKAMDSKNEQPQNIYITALDSRSFAEYMNDNADILTAVLAKQGALGR